MPAQIGQAADLYDTGHLSRPPANWAYPIGFWSAVTVTILGIFYLACILVPIPTGGMTLPPPGWLQSAGGLVSLFSCPLLVALIAALHVVTPPEKQALSLTSLGFTVLFAGFVSINRYTQFGAVRQNLLAGTTTGIDWFLPYGEHSVMLGLEIAGWGWFLGLALLAAAPPFGGDRSARWLAGLCLIYAVLGIIATAGFLLASPISAIGFVAWGFVLFLITGLLAARFGRNRPGV